jgi:hypothetical protein
MRRRAVIRTINPRPILRSLAQRFADRIHQDITGLLFQFVMVAQAVIEEIALPVHAMMSSDELLPVLDSRLHSRFTRERNNRMQMIRHEQAQAAMPEQFFMVKFHRGKHRGASVLTAQLVFARQYAADGDKEPTAVIDPLWNGVRQLFAAGQSHAWSVPRRCTAAKRKR